MPWLELNASLGLAVWLAAGGLLYEHLYGMSPWTAGLATIMGVAKSANCDSLDE